MAFSTKYDKSVQTLVTDELLDIGIPISARQINDRLAAKGYVFTSQSISYALVHAINTGTIVQVNAPPYSSARYHYEIPQHATEFLRRTTR